MHSRILASALALLALVLAVAAATDKLVIDVVSKPDECAQKSKAGDLLSMHYRGTLDDGSQFDASYDRQEPFDFELGAGQVIKGWDEGLKDMCVGEKRKLTIPYEMAYGEFGYPPVIPARATLHFDVELLEIKNARAEL
ncbi:hypothetical protein BCR44DRAFT_35564 [Catenaria anguillulae PL171]|uniref:peptidylprolyl isomerase n=1 Tax=Catenaria anguillulae PL171 TaxID=765915 RepID=A0A1Y2HJL6_9FUNG|nr:hypothetical protein BCR44DRAFT_35564 [Catenaria anguillulae PL171]